MSARRRRASRKPEETASQLDHLVVIRESARYDRVLMDGMIQQTLASVEKEKLPGATELRAAGMDVLENPRRWGGTDRRVGSSRLVTVERDGVLYLYSMGTAAKDDLEDTNAFVSELLKIVEAYKPQDVWVAAFTRLLRSANYVGELLQAFTENTRTIHCETVINVATPEGTILFQVLGMIAAIERDYIVRRHTAGRVAQWRRGEWIPNAYPPGYRLEHGRLVLDEPAIDSTRQMLRVLANSALAPAECAAAIGALGITTPRIARLHGEDATILDARNPSSVIATLCGWVDLYATGTYELLWPNPFPGVRDIAGVEVQQHSDYEHGVLSLTQSVPLPDGGWIDDRTLDLIRQRLRTPSPTGGASHKFVPPLSGLFGFAAGSEEFMLARGTRTTYWLLRRAVRDERRFAGWTDDETVECVAVVSRTELQESIADGVTRAVRDGVAAELDAFRYPDIGPLPKLNPRRAELRALRSQFDEACKSLERARRNAQIAGDDDAATVFVEDVKRHYASRTRLEKQLAELEATIDEPELDKSFESNCELVAYAMAGLRQAGRSAPVALRDALRTVVSGSRLWLAGTRLWWELFVELPHPDGTVVLGPVRGDVGVEKRPTAVDQAHFRRRRRSLTKRLVEAGLDQQAAMCAAACPHDGLSDVLFAHLRGSGAPDGVDGEYAALIAKTYSTLPFTWNPGHWRLTDQVRREFLTMLRAAGGSLGRDELLEAGMTESQLRYLTRHTDTPSGEPIALRDGRGSKAMYRALTCPHCGGQATHSIVTPETKPGVLCTTCWRTPRVDSPIFPQWYRE